MSHVQPPVRRPEIGRLLRQVPLGKLRNSSATFRRYIEVGMPKGGLMPNFAADWYAVLVTCPSSLHEW